MKKIVKLTESDLAKMVKRILNESDYEDYGAILSTTFKELKKYYDMCVNTQSNPLSNRYADDIYDAIDGLGTDEEKIVSVFQQFKTFDEFCATKTSYANIHKANMLKDIRQDNDQLNIDGSDKEIYKQLSRTVRSLYEKKDEELENRAKQCGYNSVQEYKASNWYCKPSNTNSSDQNSELLLNARKCGHKTIEAYKNSGWSCKGRGRVGGQRNVKIVKENLSTRTGDLYAGINELIDREFDDVEPSEVVRILSNILKHHEGRVYRDKHNIKPITSKEVVKNFRNFRRD